MAHIWENDFKEAIDNLSGDSRSYDEFYDSVDEEEISSLFKESIIDYKRLFKRCSKEGAELDNESESYIEEYDSSSPSARLQVIANLQEQIQEMISLCENPPKYIVDKYSDDLVARIGNGIIDGFEVEQ